MRRFKLLKLHTNITDNIPRYQVNRRAISKWPEMIYGYFERGPVKTKKNPQNTKYNRS
jgi:hypothetical protein